MIVVVALSSLFINVVVYVYLCLFQISFCRNSVAEQERVVESVHEEIQMMSKLNHPNIVRILGATQQGCHFFMFVEWMPGKHRPPHFIFFITPRLSELGVSLNIHVDQDYLTCTKSNFSVTGFSSYY